MLVPRRLRPTKDRLVAAASALFAERGFEATTVRDIAERAGANVAAGHYHYGSKKALYLEVLREQFTAIRAELDRRGARRPAAELARLSRAALERLLRSRVLVMLEIMIGPPPGLHGTLMQREMCDPSEALPVIVDELIRPMMGELEDVLARLAPALGPAAVQRCAYSIVGQALFYRFAMPALLLMHGWSEYPRALSRELADHITAFSLGGMTAAATSRRARAR
jgi:TetR/AcrR family transcriptional regulator, regulator of cefoperazone and chloramphenicol sensitivity